MISQGVLHDAGVGVPDMLNATATQTIYQGVEFYGGPGGG